MRSRRTVVSNYSASKAGYLTPAAARVRIAKTRARITGFLFDTDGDIGRSYGVRTTPSFFIVGSDGKLAYQGAMDNETFGPRPGARHYMKLALDDLAAGRSVDEPETVPEGCAVEY